MQLKQIEKDILKAIGILILKREEESEIKKKININAHNVSIVAGRSYITTKKYLKQFSEL